MSWYKPENNKEKVMSWLLRPLSALYYLGLFSRLTGYRVGMLRQKKLNVPVISIGNVTVGGTGKTPITIDLARSLAQFGLKVGILSRGYRRQSSDRILVVSDGRNILVDARQAGDEPYLIASSAPGSVVIVSADRYLAGELAVNHYGCDILILDDGFQHLKLARDFEVVVYDYNDDPETLHLLPCGRLREPLASIARADCLVISKIPDNPDPDRLQAIYMLARRFNPSIPILTCRFETEGLRLVYTNQKVIITTRGPGTRVFAFCGIARPEGFFKQLEETGCVIAGRTTFPDHHWLSESDLARLKEQYIKSGARLLVTTCKDRVRLSDDFIDQVPLAELVLTTSWGSSTDDKPATIVDMPGLQKLLKKKRRLVPGTAR